MARTLLRIQCLPGDQPGEYLQFSRYALGGGIGTEDETEITFACTPYELAPGFLLEDRCVMGLATDERQARYTLRYAGNGVVEELYEYNFPACPLTPIGCDLSVPILVVTPPSQRGLSDGILEVQANSSRFPLLFVLNGSTNSTGQTTGIFTGLADGIYSGIVEDSAGCQQRFGPTRLSGTQSDARQWLKYDTLPLMDNPFDPNEITGWELLGYHYEPTTRTAVLVREPAYQYEPPYSKPLTELVDSFLLADGVTFRKLFHNGLGGLRIEDSGISPGGGSGTSDGLRFLNVIRTDVDEPGTATGAVLLEVAGNAGLVTFTRLDTGQTNTTGGFSGLPAGTIRYRATDIGGQSAEIDVTIQDRYRPKWQLLTQDYARIPVRVVILERDYDGPVLEVCGATSDPISRRWEGQSDPLSDLPEVAGQALTLRLLTADPAPFEVLATGDDRRHRLDLYRGVTEALEFRGYVQPDLLRVAIHAPYAVISIDAADGLKALSSTLFYNHVGEDVLRDGRWPLLHTILHSLSRTDVNLPLYVGVQLRDQLHADTDEPVATIMHDRSAYGEEPVLYDMLSEQVKPFYATIWQARGAWWLASPLDMALPEGPVFTGYDGAGNSIPLPEASRMLDWWAVRNPGEAAGSRDLTWLGDGAEQTSVAAAKLSQATVKLQLRDNNLPGGEFEDWNPAATLPIGWSGAGAHRVPGSKAGTWAVELDAVPLLSPPMETRPDPDYSPILLKLSARSVAPALPSGQPASPALLEVQTFTDGIPDPVVLTLEIQRVGPEGKFTEQSVSLPATRTGRSVRIQIQALPPAINGPVQLDYVRLSILPALVEWPESDTVTVTRADGVLRVPTVDLVHADLPRLALAPNVYSPTQGMDVLAWRHAWTLLNGQATTLWRRPGVRQPAPLLETAALDRLALRTGVQRTLTGSLLGHQGVGGFCLGSRVLSPDAKGLLLWVVGCEVEECSGTVRATLRAIGAAPESPVPPFARVLTSGILRRTTDGRVRVYRP